MKTQLFNTLQLITALASCLCVMAVAAIAAPQGATEYFVYIGTYTGPQSQGIYVYKFSTVTGRLEPLGLAGESNRPSFLTIHPNHRYLYAVNEINHFGGKRSGSVSSFAIDRKTGKLKALNVVPSGDPGACHLVVDHTGKYVLVANYNVASVAAFPILADGSLGNASAFLPLTGHSVDPKRQEAAHAHSIYASPDNRFAVTPDLGTDQVHVFRFDATTGTLTPNQPPFAMAPAGSGPRHFAWGADGKFGYVIEEMGSSITTFSYDAEHGVLHALNTVSTLPPDFKGHDDSAEVYVHPNGRFLYGSNRGSDTIAVFALDPVKGTPTPVQYAPTGGKTPRGFCIDPTGSYLIAGNMDSNSLVVFRIDKKTGRLTPTGQKEDLYEPVCVMFEPIE
jgi:6-phosphogluconolactonase